MRYSGEQNKQVFALLDVTFQWVNIDNKQVNMYNV